MNNGKVRIYELSKELNLENKDILDICAQLDVPVKSHSSTITELQAGQIRQAAKKYSPQATSRRHSSASGNGSNVLTKSASGRSKGKRKQQILALHKQNRSASPTTSQPSQQQPSPTLAAPPRPPQPPSSPKPASSYPPAEPSPQLKAPASPAKVEETSPAPKLEEELDNAEPKLMRPPARPPEEMVQEKPKLREPKVAPKPAPTEEPSTEEPSPQPEPVAQESLTLKEPPRRQKPQQPKPASDTVREAVVEPEEQGEEESLLEGPEKPKQKLKRPAPPRSKPSAWEEEEDPEGADSKKAKSATKTKRRPQPVIDEDEEDLDSLTNSTAAAAAVNLSIARPPKPQSEQPAASTQPTTRKKKAPPRTDGSSARTKERRSARKEEIQRPEQVVLEGNLTVRELSERLKVPETEIITKLFLKGTAINITQTLDFDTARVVAEEFGIEVETAEETAAATKSTEMLEERDLDNLQRRPPVVTIMGHVDHGKTTLLDSIRQTKVAQGEAGGITQHIGAYHVDVEHNDAQEQVVFLDTPGHEAFTAMRARGTRVTDIAILVVAADDGVQPQTREAISHARAAEVPIVVAVNKIDKPGAEPDRVKQELTELNLVPEEWGGDTIMVSVSALKGENLDTLLEMILLVAEIEELSANPNRPAKGTVIEANLDRTRGPVATLLVQNGTLRVGDIIVAGSVFGKIRAMIDDRGERVEDATPSFAVEVLGINDVPAAGDEFDVFPTEKEARAVAQQRADAQRQTRLQQAMSSRRVTLSSLSAQAQEGELKELNLILKADVQGSVEAILGSLNQLPQDEVQIRVLLAAPGEVTETDVDLAAASGAVIVGFSTTLASGARQTADQEGVDIREYDIIYKLLEDIQGAMEGLLEPEEVEQPLGTAQVRAVFPVGRGTVAGCYVQSGKLIRNRLMRVRRGEQVVHQGPMDSLKRIREDVREVNAGYECGVGSSKFNDWQEGDIIEAYEMVMKRRTLSS